jgi:pimeloyl-ACP methyl ester carboxylesterase
MRAAAGLVVGLIALAVAPAAVRAQQYAPLDQPGPPLSVPAAALKASLVCTDDVAHARRPLVLLLSGTAINSHSMYGWNVERALRADQIPFCTSDQQGALQSNMDDLQTRGEYVTYAIRTMYALAGRRIAVLGHSQGGMIARWSLRFWPDTRQMVEKVIGVAADNHGTTDAGPACTFGCSAAFWQQGPDSNFILALNSRAMTFPGTDYTEIYTNTDELVRPPAASSSLPSSPHVSNIAVQDVCPTDNPDHMLLGTVDPVAWALIVDALDHDGPADPKRISTIVCAEGAMPGVNDPTLAADMAAAAVYVSQAGGYPHVPSEPPLRCYVTATCPARTVAPACRSGRILRVRIERAIHTVLRATLDGRRLALHGRRGHGFVLVDLRGRRRPVEVLRIVGHTAAGRRVEQVRRFRTCHL